MRSARTRRTIPASQRLPGPLLMAVLVGLGAATLGCDEPSRSASHPAGAVVRVRADGVFLPPGERTRLSESIGSGFLIDDDGTIVTAYHVVAGASRVVVSMMDSDEEVAGEIIASSECFDLALIQAPIDDADAETLTLLPDENSMDAVEIGDEVRAFSGSDDQPETTGVIVDNERRATPLTGPAIMIEHSAPLRVGASGGPLLRDGVVIGVNVALDDDRSIAVSVQHVRDLREDDTGTPTLGVNALSLPAGDSSERGVRVVAVTPGSLADRGGVLPGDVIQRIDGHSLRNDDTLTTYCSAITDAGTGPLPIDVIRPSSGTFFSSVLDVEPPLSTASD